MNQKVKRWVGRGLFSFCNRFPRAKPWLRSWGLRTSKEWFDQRVAWVQLPDGRSLRLASLGQNYLSFELFWRGTDYYEPITTLVVRELASAGGTFIDAGANIGFYSLILGLTQPQLKIIAFEPNPKNFGLLVENVMTNNLRNVTCESLALSDGEGNASLFLSASDMSASLERDFDSLPAGAVPVKTTSLDSYLGRPGWRKPLLIKVDVEGHESAFFRGARHTLLELKPDIITEVALEYDPEPMAFLREAGYRWYQITDQGLLAAETLSPVMCDRLVFLNYLLSARHPTEVWEIFERIKERVRRIDLFQTSKFLSPEALDKFTRRQATCHEV